MNHMWKFFVRRYRTGQRRIIDIAQYYEPDADYAERSEQCQVNVYCQEKPEVPIGKLSESDLLRWKAAQIERGATFLPEQF